MYTHAMGSRERLLEAMCELMWRHGYSAVSPREVRELSGVGQGSMYHYFPTKRDLGLAALWRNCRAHADAVTAVLDSADELLDAVTAYIAMPRQALKGCRAGRMVQDRAVMTDDEFCAPVAQTFDETHRRLTAVIEAAIAAGELPAELDADRLAYTVAAVFQGGYVLAIAQQDPDPCDAARQGVLDLLRLAADAAPAGATIEAAVSPSPSTSAPADAGADRRTASEGEES